MSGFDLAIVALAPVLIGAGVVGARWLAGRLHDRIERQQIEAEREAVALLSPRPLVLNEFDLEGRN